MCAADQVDVLLFQEVRHHVRPEDKTHPPFILLPPLNALLRVRPQQVTQQSLVRHLHGPHNLENLLKTLQLRTQPAMHAQYFLINQRTDRHDVEHICEQFP